MEGHGNTARRWTCQACGCNTNQASDRTCSVCGTSDGNSLLRRSGYAVRAGLFARSVAARRAFNMEDELGVVDADDDPLDRIDDVEMAGENDDEDVVAALAMEVAGVPSIGRLQDSRRQRLLDAARSFGMLSNNDFQRANPADLLRVATDNSALYQPKWATNPSQIGGSSGSGSGGRVRNTETGIVIGDGGRQNVAHLPMGAGEGRAIRAANPLPRGSSSFSFSSTGNPSSSNLDRRQRRALGFRVAFDHPRREQGRSMGGSFLIGVTTSSFNSFGERNGLPQSACFWGIEDSGSKFEGSRHASPRSARRGPSHYAIEVLPTEAPRNVDNVLFGCRDVVTVVVDLETRSLTFWRNETLLGTLVTNLPRGGNIFPVVAPLNEGVTVAITAMNEDPIPFLVTFASDWRRIQQEKDDARRRKVAEHRAILIQNRRPTAELVVVLRHIFSSYSSSSSTRVHEGGGGGGAGGECGSSLLPFAAAARLWYRCGMKLGSLSNLMETKQRKSAEQSTNSEPPLVNFKDYLEIIIRVIDDEENSGRCDYSFESAALHGGHSDVYKVGDKVELAEGYESFCDASNGPLRLGDRGTVIEVQQGQNGEMHSVRVLFNGRRWWYQPQALVSESSGLTESPVAWFLRNILRAHGFDHTTLQPLWGKPLTTSSWQVGDVVCPRGTTASSVVKSSFGRIIAETDQPKSPLSSRANDSGSVLVEFVDYSFGEATGVLSGGPIASEDSEALHTRRVRLNRLLHSKCISAADPTCRGPHRSCVDGVKALPTILNSGGSSCCSGDQALRTVGMINSKLMNLIHGVTQLDVALIEELCAEFGKNVASLAISFSRGLPDILLTAVEKSYQSVSGSHDGGQAQAPAFAALGDLAVCIANKIFCAGVFKPDFHGSVQESLASNEPALRRGDHQRRDQGDGEAFGSRIYSDTQPGMVADGNNAGRLSSMQQRRNMLLALMSRARRGSAGIADEQQAAVRGAAQVGDGSMSPFYDMGIGSPLTTFVGRGGLAAPERNMNYFERVSRHPDSSRFLQDRGNSPTGPSGIDSNDLPTFGSTEGASSARFLDSILRGFGEAAQGGSRNTIGKVLTSAMMRSLIANGLLGNNVKWVQAVVAAQTARNTLGSSIRDKVGPLENAVDEDGTPLLVLAIYFGCSESIIRYLISQGVPVSEKELKTAAASNQPEILSILLDHCMYVPGTIDTKFCSPAVALVLDAAAAGQTELECTMRNEAAKFFPLLISKMLHYGRLLRRLHSPDAQSCSKHVAHWLAGNVILDALHEHQRKSMQQGGGASDTFSSNEASVPDAGRVPFVFPSVGSGATSCLLEAVPSSILKDALFQEIDGDDIPSIVTYLLLVEDHLCLQGVDSAGVGLSLLRILLKHFPCVAVNGLADRFGFSELVSFHEAYATSRVAQISSQLVSCRGGLGSDNMKLSGSTGAIFCPKRHLATLHITRHSSFRCDLCGKAVERGRPMHGCRGCDWDACENCTDKAESGVAKWLKVREMALECQQLLSADEQSLLRADYDQMLSDHDRLLGLDGASQLNRLSTRLLQRDFGALRQLKSMLESPGCITAHQFLNIILPSLHSSLVVRSEFCRSRRTGPRCKKARVVFPSRDENQTCATFSGSYRQYCKMAFEYLVAEEASTKTSSVDLGTPNDFHSREPHRGGGGDNENEDISDDEDRERTVSRNSHSHENVPELIRRLHQALSFYQSISLVKVVPASIHRAYNGNSFSGELQALAQPFEVELVPSAFGRRTNAPSSFRCLPLLVEPLSTMFDLEKLILSTFRIVHPSYVTFCRRLALDKALIAEKPRLASPRLRSETAWRLGRVESYDENIGAHRICYANGVLQGSDGGDSIFEQRAESISDRVTFDCHSSCVILAAREFVVLRRQPVEDIGIREPALFGMEVALNENGTSDVHSIIFPNPDSPLASCVGGRVDCLTGQDSHWHPHTIISVTTAGPNDHSLSESARYTIVSDDGIVHSNMLLDQIRGLEASAMDRFPTPGVRERAFGANSVLERRFSSSRTFSFGPGRREIADARWTPQGNETRRGVLKRTWSALSPVEAMDPLELCICGDESSGGVTSREGTWRCRIGEKMAHVVSDVALIEYPPCLRLGFSTSDALPTVDVPSDGTLISALRRLCNRDERTRDQPIFLGQPIRLFFSISLDLCSDQSDFLLPSEPLEAVELTPLSCEPLAGSSNVSLRNAASFCLDVPESAINSWLVPNRSRKLSLSNLRSEVDATYSEGLCDGLDEVCIQCMDLLSLLAECAEDGENTESNTAPKTTIFESLELTQKLIEQLDDPLTVVGGAMPDWCTLAPSYAPRIFSYEARKLLLERAAFGVSRSVLRQQESKVNVSPLRKRMAAFRGRAVELVGEAFSGGAEDPTALQLQADELYGMEEALAARVKAAFRAQKWDERALQVAKAAVRRESLLHDAAAVMAGYATDPKVYRRRLEVRFDGESGFDAASGDEAGVTRGFYADVAEALLSCDHVSGVLCNNTGPGLSADTCETKSPKRTYRDTAKLPLWIPDMDASGQIIIPTPRADPKSGLGVYPRPLPVDHPQIKQVLVQFRFIGRLFAAAMRDGFMFPVPLSAAFLKLVQHAGQTTQSAKQLELSHRMASKELKYFGTNCHAFDEPDTSEIILSSPELPRPGFIGGEVFAVEMYICRVLDDIDENNPPLSGSEIEKRYRALASDMQFARTALGKSYDCSFEVYFQDRTFVDPFDPSQGELAAPLCPNGHNIPVTIFNIREWVTLAKQFILHDGVLAQAQAFRDGVEDFFPSDFLRVFIPDELQRDVCGSGDQVDTWDEPSIRRLFKLDGGNGSAEAMVAVSSIVGEGSIGLSRRFGPSSPTVKHLVKALLEAPPQQRRQFLSFVTSVPIVTPGLIEVVPIVAPNGEFLPMRDPGCLPRANTCAKRLYLPKFDTYESFSTILWAVVREESKFKGFYEWRG